MRLILKINDNVSIWSDFRQCIVKVGKVRWYFGGLEECFLDIYDHLCKEKLEESTEKNFREIRKIILEVKDEIIDIINKKLKYDTTKGN